MPHIHTEPGQHDATVSGWIVRTDMDEPRILVITHKKIQILLQPGGHVELDENPWQAISHELPEETGYTMNQLKLLQPPIPRFTHYSHDLSAVHPMPLLMNTHRVKMHDVGEHYHSDTAYLFVTKYEPVELPGPGESQDLRWLSRREIESLPADDILRGARETALFIFDNCLDTWERVDVNAFAV